ncbi:hypothetical protein HDV00_002969 [Rhizophlyctis rosea]|nr:hypothetical protein HDV00_002969 [Rhizophlyctis rosea]
MAAFQERNQDASLLSIPAELIGPILLHLDIPSLCRVEHTCRYLRAISQKWSNSLWLPVVSRLTHSGTPPRLLEGETYKDVCSIHYAWDHARLVQEDHRAGHMTKESFESGDWLSDVKVQSYGTSSHPASSIEVLPAGVLHYNLDDVSSHQVAQTLNTFTENLISPASTSAMIGIAYKNDTKFYCKRTLTLRHKVEIQEGMWQAEGSSSTLYVRATMDWDLGRQDYNFFIRAWKLGGNTVAIQEFKEVRDPAMNADSFEMAVGDDFAAWLSNGGRVRVWRPSQGPGMATIRFDDVHPVRPCLLCTRTHLLILWSRLPNTKISIYAQKDLIHTRTIDITMSQNPNPLIESYMGEWNNQPSSAITAQIKQGLDTWNYRVWQPWRISACGRRMWRSRLLTCPVHDDTAEGADGFMPNIGARRGISYGQLMMVDIVTGKVIVWDRWFEGQWENDLSGHEWNGHWLWFAKCENREDVQGWWVDSEPRADVDQPSL